MSARDVELTTSRADQEQGLMTSNAQLFVVKLENPAFKAAFEVADAARRQKLLDQAGLLISLKEAEAIFSDLAGELSEADLEQAAGGFGSIFPVDSTEDDIP